MGQVGEAERVASDPDVAALLNPVPAQRARLLLAHGEVMAAVRWTSQRGLHARRPAELSPGPEYLVLARVLLAEQAPERALRLLGRLHEGAAVGRCKHCGQRDGDPGPLDKLGVANRTQAVACARELQVR
jgi:LuxR family maltose regulon positive regulatory protein